MSGRRRLLLASHAEAKLQLHRLFSPPILLLSLALSSSMGFAAAFLGAGFADAILGAAFFNLTPPLISSRNPILRALGSKTTSQITYPSSVSCCCDGHGLDLPLLRFCDRARMSIGMCWRYKKDTSTSKHNPKWETHRSEFCVAKITLKLAI